MQLRRRLAELPANELLEVTPETYEREIAPARTFGFLREAEELRARGLALGATLDNALVLDEKGLAGGELRFQDEFVRHKALDCIGDLYLAGAGLIGLRERLDLIGGRLEHGPGATGGFRVRAVLPLR